MTDGRLSDDEAALVFRRAAEVDRDLDLAHRAGGWDVADLEAVGRDAGIQPEAIHRAVAEIRLQPRSQVPEGANRARSHLRTTVERLRMVPVDAATAQARLTEQLREQLFEPVREQPGTALFERPRTPEVERRLRRDSSGRYRLRGATSVSVAATDAPGGAGALVRVEAESSFNRFTRAAAVGSVTAVGKWLGLAVVVNATDLGVDALWTLTPLVVVGGGAWGWWRAGVARQRAELLLARALDGALDRLER